MRKLRRWTGAACLVICCAVALVLIDTIRRLYPVFHQRKQGRIRHSWLGTRDLSEGEIDLVAFFDAHDNRDRIQQELYGKAFGSSVHQTRIIPYYFKKGESFSKERLTLTTWLTVDRLERLAKIADAYRGPISAVFHLSPNNTLATEELRQLHRLWRTHPSLSQNTDLHLVTSRFTIQHNAWRNAARFFAGTDWMFMVDVDFDICGDLEGVFERFVRDAEPGLQRKLETGNIGLVVPAFEWVDEQGTGCPASRSDLISSYQDVQIDIFELETPSLHFATDYSRLMQADRPYPTRQFDWMYEPYLIFRRDVPFWCDERFMGFGYDRAACVGEMYLRGMELHVLVDAYVVHEAHFRVEISKRMRRQNRMHWYTFRKELCVRLAQELEQQHLLHMSAGDRIREHCQLDREDNLDHYMDEMMRESEGPG